MFFLNLGVKGLTWTSYCGYVGWMSVRLSVPCKQLKGSVKERNMHLFCCDFSSCSESTEIWHAYSFWVKKYRVFFFKKAEKYGPNCTKIHPTPLPLCPSPNIVGFQSLRTKTLHVCFTPLEGGSEEGGGLSRACLKPCFPTCGKKNRDIFWHKKSQHAKFHQIPENLKNRNEIGTHASLWRSPSISVAVNFHSVPGSRKCWTVRHIRCVGELGCFRVLVKLKWDKVLRNQILKSMHTPYLLSTPFLCLALPGCLPLPYSTCVLTTWWHRWIVQLCI